MSAVDPKNTTGFRRTFPWLVVMEAVLIWRFQGSESRRIKRRNDRPAPTTGDEWNPPADGLKSGAANCRIPFMVRSLFFVV
ncbi:hypothetical protein NG726_06890 [Pseudomonas sp. MOB-449]|nr:hypothetical protein [Pseudomonas sp. MOB-449]